MNKTMAKSISVLTAVVLVCSGVMAGPVYAGSTQNGSSGKAETGFTQKSVGEDFDIAPQKEETVYVLADASGNVNKIIVSEWLKNPNGAARLGDTARLDDVKNVKGSETYTLNEDGMRVWDAAQNDIYFQGTTDSPLPVKLSVSYELGGEPISAEDLAGKSGRVKIKFDYDNKVKKTVEVDGKKRTVSVPFVMLTGLMLDNSRFTNVEVSNGKLMNDGDKSVVVGFALPGMQENLGIKSSELKIPESVEISADVTDFSLLTTLTVASNGLFSEIDENKLDSLSDLSGAVNDLSSASRQLVDGSSDLYSGVSELLSKSDLLIAGINKLSGGAKQLEKGTKQLKTGGASLKSGVSELAAGLKQLDGKSPELVGGAKTVFDTLLSGAQTQLAASGLKFKKLTVSNYKTVLNGALGSLDKDKALKLAHDTALQKVTVTVNQNEAVIRAQVEAAVRREVQSGVLKAAGIAMTPEQYEQAVAGGLVSKEIQAAVTAGVNAQMSSDAILAKIRQEVSQQKQKLINDNMNSDDVKSRINEAVKSAEEGRKSLLSLISQLDSYKQFYSGVVEYTKGVSKASDSAGKQLKDGTNELVLGIGKIARGAKTLSRGVTQLGSKSKQLVGGVGQLKSGAMTLSKGMKKFNDEGIEKLAGAANGDIESVLIGVKATIKAAKAYKSFAGAADETDSRVNFVYRTDSIER